MCGLFGYIGNKNAYDEVYSGLTRLQYRGYDSCGIAYIENSKNNYKIIKNVGSLNKIKKIKKDNHIAFGHTRWATTGKVSRINAHPHISNDKKVVIVHNGIISNYKDIKISLKDKGVRFKSQTDTEVIANYISRLDNIDSQIHNIFNIVKGSYSLIIGVNDVLYLVKMLSPLNILKNKDGIYISSDISSLPAGKLYSLNDFDIIRIQGGVISKIYAKNEVANIVYKIYKDRLEDIDKKNYDHYMIKEIYETPEAISRTFNCINKINVAEIFSKFNSIVFLGCGTAYNSCLIGKYYLDKLNRFSTEVILASNYEVNENIKKNKLHIIVSQSGETADCILVAKKIKEHNGKILIITNEEDSTLSKFADYVIYTKAGKEIAVASTKTYCSQLFVFIYIYKCLNNENLNNIDNLINELNAYIKNLDVTNISKKISKSKELILIGRGVDYLTIVEAALKIREIDYIFTLPMFSSELKHGTLALIDNKSLVISLETTDDNLMLETKQEIEARKGTMISVSVNNKNVDMCFQPIFSIIPFQLISYNIALFKGYNPDMPRNLAKSVTVI